jgi:hypothetical protein
MNGIEKMRQAGWHFPYHAKGWADEVNLIDMVRAKLEDGTVAVLVPVDGGFSIAVAPRGEFQS